MEKVSVILPAYNEAEQIGESTKKVLGYLRNMSIDFELIITDDGSADKTAEIVEKIQKSNKEVRLIRNPVHMGRGEALSTAFKNSWGDIVAFMDVDLATDISYLPELIGAIKNGADVATGSRWEKGAIVRRSFFRSFISFWYNSSIRIFFGSKIRDHQCGFKAFKKKAILKLIKEAGIKKNRGWAWDVEILIRAQKSGYNVSEFPVRWNEGKRSKFKPIKDVYQVGTYLLTLWWDLRKSA